MPCLNSRGLRLRCGPWHHHPVLARAPKLYRGCEAVARAARKRDAPSPARLAAPQPDAEWIEMLEIDQSYDGRTENPTTGYRWELQSALDPALSLEDDSFARAGTAPGAGGLRSWRFRATRAGVFRLGLALKRSWQPRPIETFKVDIRAGPP